MSPDSYAGQLKLSVSDFFVSSLLMKIGNQPTGGANRVEQRPPTGLKRVQEAPCGADPWCCQFALFGEALQFPKEGTA